MYTLRLSTLQKVTMEDIPLEETDIEVVSDTPNLSLSSLNILINKLFERKGNQLTTIKLNQLNLDGCNSVYFNMLKSIISKFHTVYLNKNIIPSLSDSIKNNLCSKKRLIIVNDAGDESSHEDLKTIMTVLEPDIKEKEFHPEKIQNYAALKDYEIKKVIASIPDKQSVLDLSNNNFTNFQFVHPFVSLMKLLPKSLTTLKLQNINIHTIGLDLYFLAPLIAQFQVIYFTEEEIKAIHSETSVFKAMIISQLTQALSKVDSVILVNSKGEEKAYTSEEMYCFLNKEEIELKNRVQEINQQVEIINTKLNNNKPSKRKPVSPTSNISMMILGGFIAAVGIAAIALTVTLLGPGFFFVGIGAGITTALIGLGLFATGAYQESQSISSNYVIV